MRLHDFFPIADPDLGAGLTIEELFGPEFCAVDEAGQMLTTKRNQLLLMNARAVMRGFGGLDPGEIQPRLAELAGLADVVSQDDYDRAVQRAIVESNASRAQPERTADLSSRSPW